MDFDALLRRRTAEVDRLHRQAMATIDEDLRAVHLGEGPGALARRRFLQRAGAGAVVAIGGAVVPIGAMAAAAQEGGPDDTAGGGEDPTGGAAEATTEASEGLGATAPSGEGGGEAEELDANEGCEATPVDAPEADITVVRFAESVERAAVAAYELVIQKNLLASAAAESARKFHRHHEEHAEALYCLVPAEAEAPANQALVDAVQPQVEAATDAQAAAQLLYDLEEGAAATYAFALGVLESADVAGAAARILPVESQHAVVWGQFLELPIADWMPAFQSETGAFDPAEYAAS